MFRAVPFITESGKDDSPKTQKVIDRTSGEDKDDKQLGYVLYLERRGEKYKPRRGRVLLDIEGTENLDMIKCEQNVYKYV